MSLLLSSSGSTENEGNKLLRNADIYQSTRCEMSVNFDLYHITIITLNFKRHIHVVILLLLVILLWRLFASHLPLSRTIAVVWQPHIFPTLGSDILWIIRRMLCVPLERISDADNTKNKRVTQLSQNVLFSIDDGRFYTANGNSPIRNVQ
jgi:hypothetical protein